MRLEIFKPGLRSGGLRRARHSEELKVCPGMDIVRGGGLSGLGFSEG